MDATINQIANSLGVAPEWVWFGLGALSMLMLRSIFSARSSSHSLNRGEVQTKNVTGTTAASFKVSSQADTVALNLEESAELKALLSAGNKIGAIKLIREKSGLGLAEAKSVCEALERALQSKNSQ